MDKKYKELSKRLDKGKKSGANFRKYEEISTGKDGSSQEASHEALSDSPGESGGQSRKIIKKYSGKPEKKPGKKFDISFLVGSAIPIVIVLLIIISGVYFLLRKNVAEVKLNDVVIGQTKTKNVTEEALYETVKAKIEGVEGTDIEIQDKITVTPARGKSKLIMNDNQLTNALTEGLNYKIEAAEITVNGEMVGIARNQEDAQLVFSSIYDKFKTNAENTTSRFVEDVKTTARFVNKEEIDSLETLQAEMEKNTSISSIYEVKSGDTLSTIAAGHGMTMPELKEQNPELDVNKMLKIGDKLNIVTNMPFVSVETTETKVETQPIPREIVEQTDDSLGSGQKRIITQGKDGVKEITTKIVSINGIVTDTGDVTEKVIEEPEDQVVAIGG